jgi:phage-related protein
MAKVIDHGMAKPNDPIYTSGPVVGDVRFGGQYEQRTNDWINIRGKY